MIFAPAKEMLKSAYFFSALVCGSGVFDRVNKTNCELIVPVISVTAYKQAEVWNEFSNIRGFSGVEVTVADKTRKIVVE